MHTKFEVPRYDWAQTFKNGSHNPDHAPFGDNLSFRGLVWYSLRLTTLASAVPEMIQNPKEILVENFQFYPTSPIFGVPARGDPLEFHEDLWHHKTRIPGLSCGVVRIMIHSAILIEHGLVSDRQTDGRTDRWTRGYSIYRTGTASRGNKETVYKVTGCSGIRSYVNSVVVQ